MEASPPFLSADELRTLPGVTRGLRVSAHAVLLWHADGSVSFATRAPDGQLWLDQRAGDGTVRRAGPLPLGAHTGFAARRGGGSGPSAEPQDRVLARTAGTVSRVHVAAGDAVQPGQLLVTIELMKMELQVEAPRACTIVSVEVRERQALEKGSVLVRLR